MSKLHHASVSFMRDVFDIIQHEQVAAQQMNRRQKVV